MWDVLWTWSWIPTCLWSVIFSFIFAFPLCQISNTTRLSIVGTILGETLTFFMFRYWLRSRADKLERGKGSPQWAALARVIREGGFWVALVIRYSAIPTHGK
jgi:uncharacterized membrane protein YdjX (TVP38/TMEM64 family)